MCKHFYLYGTPGRPFYPIPHYDVVYFPDLMQIEFPGKHYHIRELRIESQSLRIGYAELSRYMHFDSNASGIGYGSHVGSYHRRDACSLCSIESPAHIIHILLVQHYVESQICPDSGIRAYPDNLRKILHSEIVRRVRAHVEFLDSEIYGIRPSLDGSLQAFEIACRSHDFRFRIHA